MNQYDIDFPSITHNIPKQNRMFAQTFFQNIPMDALNSALFQSKFNQKEHTVSERICQRMTANKKRQLDLPAISEVNSEQNTSFSSEYFSANIKKLDRTRSGQVQEVFLDRIQIQLLSLLLFSVDFVNAIQLVFISPFFLIVDAPILNNTIWLFPTILIFLIYPMLRILLEEQKYQKVNMRKNLLTFAGISVSIGLFIMSFSENVTRCIYSDRTEYLLQTKYLAVIGFILTDLGNEVLNSIINAYKTDMIRQEDRYFLQDSTLWGSSSGKICGYLTASLHALGFFPPIIQHVNTKQNAFKHNLSFTYFIGFCLITTAMLLAELILPKQKVTDDEKIYEEFNFNQHLKQLTINNFLPGITLIKQNNFTYQTLFPENYPFNCSSIVLMKVYATDYVGISILGGEPNQEIEGEKRKIFDLGVSFGALAMTLCTLITILTELLLNKIGNPFLFKHIFFISQSVAAIFLISTYFFQNFPSIFIIIPMCGFANSTFQAIPEIFLRNFNFQIREEINQSFEGEITTMSQNVNIPNLYRILNLTLFTAQLSMFCAVQFSFMIFPIYDNYLADLIISGICSFFAASLSLFIEIPSQIAALKSQ